MAQTYFTVPTTVGQAKLANSQVLGTALRWTHMALGDGGGSAVTVTQNRTALVHEVYRAAINHLHRDSDDLTQIVAEMIVLPETGGFTIREVGIYDSEGDLVVYGSYPDVIKPVLASGSGITLTAICRAAIGTAANVTLLVDPTSVIATRAWVETLMALYGIFGADGSIIDGNTPGSCDIAAWTIFDGGTPSTFSAA